MKLTLMEFVSLDGVYQGPGSPEEDTRDGFSGGGWLVPHLDDAFLETIVDWIEEADAFLFGRRTYEAFARDWPKVTDPDDPVATRLNGLPKYVASDSLESADWAPATILSGDVAAQVAELKSQPGREIQIHGSGSLGGSILAAGLVDELRLMIAPVIVSDGRRFLPAGCGAAGLRLIRNESTPAGVAVHAYEYIGAAQTGTYERRSP